MVSENVLNTRCLRCRSAHCTAAATAVNFRDHKPSPNTVSNGCLTLLPLPPPSIFVMMSSMGQAILGRETVSRALLVAGANADATDHNSFSPLYLAAQNGHTQVVLDLLAGGADPEFKTTRVSPALNVLCHLCSKNVV